MRFSSSRAHWLGLAFALWSCQLVIGQSSQPPTGVRNEVTFTSVSKTSCKLPFALSCFSIQQNFYVTSGIPGNDVPSYWVQNNLLVADLAGVRAPTNLWAVWHTFEIWSTDPSGYTPPSPIPVDCNPRVKGHCVPIAALGFPLVTPFILPLQLGNFSTDLVTTLSNGSMTFTASVKLPGGLELDFPTLASTVLPSGSS